MYSRPKKQGQEVRRNDSACSLPSLTNTSCSTITPTQTPATIPITRISGEEGFRLPIIQFSMEEEGKSDQWKRMRGGVHAQALGVSLQTASRRGMLLVMEFLVTQDRVDVNVLDSEHMTALHYACKRGNKDAVSLLLRLDADVNLQNKTGWTALAIASDKGYVDVCKLLIASKAKVNIHSHHDVSPLHVSFSPQYTVACQACDHLDLNRQYDGIVIHRCC
jgi:hypothetical protein